MSIYTRIILKSQRPGYFGCIFTQWEEAETHYPSCGLAVRMHTISWDCIKLILFQDRDLSCLPFAPRCFSRHLSTRYFLIKKHYDYLKIFYKWRDVFCLDLFACQTPTQPGPRSFSAATSPSEELLTSRLSVIGFERYLQLLLVKNEVKVTNTTSVKVFQYLTTNVLLQIFAFNMW